MDKRYLQLNQLFFVVMLGLIMNSFWACSGASKKDMIANKWGVKEISIDRDMSEREKKKMNMLMKKIKQSAYYHFKSNGKYEIKSLARKEKGTWRLNEDGTQLFTKQHGGDEEEKVNIKEVSAEKFVITKSTQMGDMQMVLVPKKEKNKK